VITTQSPGDARKAAKAWRDGLLIVVGGDGRIKQIGTIPQSGPTQGI
jgi:hypothetical protein